MAKLNKDPGPGIQALILIACHSMMRGGPGGIKDGSMER